MNDTQNLVEMNLPPLIQSRATSHLERIARADDNASRKIAGERAAGFVEGLEAARAITPATIEALFLLFESAMDRGIFPEIKGLGYGYAFFMAHSEKEPNTSAPYWQANSLANRLIVISNTSVTVATAAALTELNVYKFVKILEIVTPGRHVRLKMINSEFRIGDEASCSMPQHHEGA
ncbi:hypothetical protein [Pseudomonas salomonii]|uniref:Uncharacterized protein n=1 Tax=Pseudomonas salomonii TaxID=191391 RepID=A0ABS9GH51_9PSED|nr:hypothetical protein [Pseudomonas salomonii]MCF5545083.1 hypothetical protein [Pseudomonas salomonii]